MPHVLATTHVSCRAILPVSYLAHPPKLHGHNTAFEASWLGTQPPTELIHLPMHHCRLACPKASLEWAPNFALCTVLHVALHAVKLCLGERAGRQIQTLVFGIHGWSSYQDSPKSVSSPSKHAMSYHLSASMLLRDSTLPAAFATASVSISSTFVMLFCLARSSPPRGSR
ncbi:hypothetical protein B0H19DRAFT_1375760 [Mycena capillaripes]|nr:hypothetical protein B0H19DRAFT_1375760 [Mycena capillaripes]